MYSSAFGSAIFRVSCAARNSPVGAYAAYSCCTSSIIAACMSLAPPPASSSGATRIVFATARYGFSRPWPPSARSISPARRSIFTWKCRWPGSTPSFCASSRFVSVQPGSSPSISSARSRSGWPSALSCSGLSSTSVSRMTPRRLYIGSSRLVEDDDGQRRAPHEARGSVGAGLLREGPPHRLGLALARREIDERRDRVEARDRERDAVDERLEPGLGSRDAPV